MEQQVTVVATTEAETMTVLQACGRAMAFEMDVDQRVVVLGEDVGTAGGIFRATAGLQQRFGERRVIDTPLDEKGIAAHAVGMALYGMRPIVEIQFSGFIHDAFEQIMFCGSKYRWITGGEYSCPMVIRAPSFGGIKGGFWHSQSPESYFIHGGGIKVIAPSTPDDAYRLLLAAIRDPDPVLVLEPVPLYRTLSGPVIDDGIAAEIGVAHVVHPGDDVTLLTWGPLRHVSVDIAREYAARGVSVEVVDLRSLVPWDKETVAASVRKTGRVLIAHEAALTLGFGAELAAWIQEFCFGALHAPIGRVAGHDTPYGFAIGDEHYKPSAHRIKAAIERVMEFQF
jgi:pyruvate dehydrogenase E1 component beta subunit